MLSPLGEEERVGDDAGRAGVFTFPLAGALGADRVLPEHNLLDIVGTDVCWCQSGVEDEGKNLRM